MIMRNLEKIAGAALCGALLTGCIGSPFPTNTVAALYEWDERDTPLTTRAGLETGDEYQGDFAFVDILQQYPALEDRGDDPWLLESCDTQRCLSMVLYGSDFEITASLELGGYAILSPLATLMANEVSDLPAERVRGRLDELSARLRRDGLADYAEFIRLDIRSAGEARETLLNDSLYARADALLLENPEATVADLLEAPAQRTSDLVASRSFDFDSSWELKIDVDLSDRSFDAGYLLLCAGFSPAGDGYTVDYNSCALRAPLNSGIWTGQLTLTGANDELLAVLIDSSAPARPEYRLWNRSEDGDRLRLR